MSHLKPRLASICSVKQYSALPKTVLISLTRQGLFTLTFSAETAERGTQKGRSCLLRADRSKAQPAG